MSDLGRDTPADAGELAASAGDTPVNPYSLREAVNESSDTVNTGWLIFLAIMAYLLVAVAGVTHKDLLLSSDISLPILQVKIDLTRFFLFAPILLVLFHIGIVSQLVLLARKTLEFDMAMRLIEPTERRTHPLRLELHNFFFVQAIAGPDRSRVMGTLLHGMSWLTLVVLPVVLLLYVQVVFLPYHDALITWVHRIALSVDIAMLVTVGVFLMRPETTFFVALGRVGRRHPFSSIFTVALLLVVAGLSFLVATIPGEPLDRLAQSLPGARREEGTRYSMGFMLPFLGATADGTLLGLFQRNLNVTDMDLVVDKDVTPGEPTINLRGRDLRFARLDRTDLHQADFTGADLEGASFVGADLRNVSMHCADINRWLLSFDRAAARCLLARGANFTRANMSGARLAGADLQEAHFEEAGLEGAELSDAWLTAATLYSARLERASLAGAILIGANLANAALQGAELSGAKLYGADLRGAGLQAAGLTFAHLHGARLQDADLEAADLYQARLLGADLANVHLKSADLRGAAIWRSAAPGADAVMLADLTGVVLAPPDAKEVAELTQIIDGLGYASTSAELKDLLAPIMDGAAKGWAGEPAKEAWAKLAQTSAEAGGDNYKGRLTEAVTRLMCRARWASGAIATGLAKRAVIARFKGEAALLYDRMRADDCPASKAMADRRAFRDLAALVDAARGN